jgi:hypothetical protein
MQYLKNIGEIELLQNNLLANLPIEANQVQLDLTLSGPSCFKKSAEI